MAEYYAVLSKAIAGLTNASPDTRRAVYDKARNALISQLRAIEPPLPTSEISRQRLELEEAIRRVEREIQSGTLPPLPPRVTPQVLSPPTKPPAPPTVQQAAPPPRVAAAPPPPSDPVPPPAAAEGGKRSPQEIFRQAILDAEGRGWTPPQGEGAPRETPAAARATPPRERPAERPAPARPAVSRAAPARVEPDDDELPQELDDVEGFVPPIAPEQVPPPPSRAYSPPGRGAPAEPNLAPDYDYGDELPQPPIDRGREMRRGPAPIDTEIDEVPPPPPPPGGRRGWGRRKTHEDDAYGDEPPAEPTFTEPRRRRSRVPLLLFLFLVLMGGAAFAAWTQLPTIKAIIASFEVPGSKPAAPAATATLAVPDTGTQTAATPPPAAVFAPAPPSSKSSDRLGAPSSPTAPSPTVSAPANNNAPGVPATDRPPVRIVGDTPPVTTGPAGSTLTPGARPATPSTPTPGPQASLQPVPSTTTPTPAQPGVASIQKAALYEEPSDPAQAATSSIAFNGSVAWSFVNGGSNGPEIIGTVTIPDRKLKLKITIRRNMDRSLPASHLVELNVDPLAADFPGKGIQTVPSMVFKSAEDARGDILIGASATISTSPGFYWIALSSAQRDLSSNLGLLRDRGWIDIRLIYGNNQRAILTLEKGTTGEFAFAKALTAWQTG